MNSTKNNLKLMNLPNEKDWPYTTPKEPTASKGNSTVSRALQVLEVVCETSTPLTARQIGEQLGIDRLAAYRALMSLVERGYVNRCTQGSRFKASRQMLGLTHKLQESEQRALLVKAALERIAQEIGENTYYSILEDEDVIVTKRADGLRPNPISLPIGTAIPAPSAAVGRSILALQPRRVVSAILQNGLPQRTPQTLTNPIAYLNMLDRVAEQGYALEEQELRPGVSCVAVAIQEVGKMPATSLHTFGPSTRFTRNRMLCFVPILQREAECLAEQFARMPG